MTDLFDTSRIPDDVAHWAAAAQRVAANVERGSRAGTFDWFANSRASWAATSLLLAAALAFMVLSREDLSATNSSSAWTRAIAPADDVGSAIMLDDAPPAIGVLLLGRDGA